ncbi:hypothetical protein Bca52824_074577 [Brassica carinata]|uniref:Uncharacterized protein n=1 Tax=Brassica carinata TaxID=52824 RepID=A0A8X7PQG6_BRACI|nr:hypothetical protein Bca52824_074577 [Brassica carinata]
MVKVMWGSSLALAVALLLVTVANIPVAEGVTCSPTELASCSPAFMSASPPSATNPTLSQYVNSPNAKKVASSCNVATPKC